MQITNIARDVGEDLRRLNRIYLPGTWLATHGLTPQDLHRPTPPEPYPLLMETVMETAEALRDLYQAWDKPEQAAEWRAKTS